jgi:putative Mg2+ transporter-C (MgtC) family protein
LLVASLLGGLIGLERDIHGREAGLRTHLLVSLGAAVFMILSEQVARMSTGTFSDPGRIAAQIVTGIGFLGAGAIIKAGVNVRGLTTAACLWTVAAVGMAAGAGSYVLAAVTTVIALICLILLKRFERL